MSKHEPQGIPDSWHELFESAGIKPSYRALAAKTHSLDHTRTRRVILGLGTTDSAISQVAEALQTTPAVIQDLRGEEPTEPFELPDRARHLTRRQREAIITVIDAMLDSADDSEVSDPSLIAAQRAAARRQRVKDGDQSSQISQRG